MSFGMHAVSQNAVLQLKREVLCKALCQLTSVLVSQQSISGFTHLSKFNESQRMVFAKLTFCFFKIYNLRKGKEQKKCDQFFFFYPPSIKYLFRLQYIKIRNIFSILYLKL